MSEKLFSSNQTWLECIKCGFKTDLLEERKFECPECGDLFDVMHDWNQLPEFEEIRFRADERANSVGTGESHDPKRKSGIWRFKELIMPFLPDSYIVSLNEGNVPIVAAGPNLLKWIGKDIDLHIILEGMTPTGSFKDFGGTVMMSIAKAMGVPAIGCASTGDTSAMAAAYGAAADIKCFVLLPKGKVTTVQMAQPLVHGARLITLPGDFDDCMKVMQILVSEYGAFPANSLNPTRIEGHQATVFLIAQYFGWRLPHWIVPPVGNGSNCSSIGKALRLLHKFSGGEITGTKILGCQSRAANPLARSWNILKSSVWKGDYDPNFISTWQEKYIKKKVTDTAASAACIGNPVSRNKVMREIVASGGAMQVAQEEELNEAVAVCGRDGHFVCPQTGIALAGVKNAVKKGWINPNERVVVVSTATGLKFTESAAANLAGNIIDLKDCKPESTAKFLGLA
jgi:threonine synthase